MDENKIDLLDLAKKRVGFKKHLTIYILVNLALWLIWLFTSLLVMREYYHIWPIYPLIGWGIGLVFHYLRVYKWNAGWVEKEYQNLLKEKGREGL
ncbi:MAG: 2TM domain-containing protein [Bacteroidota bacterium]